MLLLQERHWSRLKQLIYKYVFLSKHLFRGEDMDRISSSSKRENDRGRLSFGSKFRTFRKTIYSKLLEIGCSIVNVAKRKFEAIL